MTRRDPRANRRVVVLQFTGGHTEAVMFDDSSVFTVNGQAGCGTFAFEGIESLSIEDAQLYELERDAFDPPGDLGRPPSEWDRP